MSRRPAAVPLAVLALLALTITPPAGPAGAAPADPGQPAPASAGAPPPQTVTLITGDRVVLRPSGYAIRPGPGRSSMIFEQYQHGSHQYVIPADAIGMVNRGRLDRRLFDVTELLASGYGDPDRADLPLIVAHGPGATTLSPATDHLVTRAMPELGMTAMTVRKRDAGQVWATIQGGVAGATALAPGITKVWLDGQRRLDLDQSVPQIGAPAAWQAGLTGAGVTAAVLDSGIDLTHPDFAGRVVEVRNFTEAPDGNDTVGHGTHVASILAGAGAASGGTYRGVAPDARLLVGKVCPTRQCPESAILAGMEWAAQQGATVVNLSLSGPDSPGVDPVEAAVDRLTAQTGALFVASSGNNGSSQPVGSPASADAALAVGAVDRQDFLAEFSSRGPRVGDTAVKPDLTAPGVGIAAARAADGTIGDPVDADYTRLDGTSMAAPHVAGAAALLAQQHPDWTAVELKAALMGSARPNPAHTVFEQGAGRVDVAGAIQQSVLASPPSLSLGRHPFPHDGEPTEQVVTFRNTGSAPATLDLTVEASGPDGLPAPPGMFAVEPSQLTLPPGGGATVTLTTDLRVASPLGVFSGALVATGDATVRVPLGLDKEPERFDLTVTHVDRTGAVTDNHTTHVLGIDTPFEAMFEFDPDGTVTLRLPPGRYHLYSVVRTATGGPVLDVAALAQPLLELADDTAIVLDARAARPTRVTVPSASARSAAGIIVYERHAPQGRALGASVAGPGLDSTYTAHVGPPVTETEMTTGIHSQWGEPGAGDFLDSPYAYHLAWFQRGRYWTGFDRQVRPRDLAVVAAEFRTPMPGRIGRQFSAGIAPEGSATAGVLFPFHLPFQRTEYYLTKGVRWLSEVETVHPQTGLVETVHTGPFRSFAPGRHREQWNRAVFGPAFPPVENATQWVYRHAGGLPSIAGARTAQDGDSIVVSVPLFTDLSPDHRLGFSREDSGRTTLFRNGELVGEASNSRSAEFPVPDEVSSYRLEVEAARPSYAELSPQVSGVWTFRSGHVPDAESVVLPLQAVRFGPLLDQHNQARAGRVFLLPVSVHRQAGAPASGIRSLAVEVSYDDGATWRPALTFRVFGQSLALLFHPRDATFVSLRAKATDQSGNSVQQDILRAYRLVPPGPG